MTTAAAIPSAPSADPLPERAQAPAPAAPAPVAEERFGLERALLASARPAERRDAVDRLAALPDAEDSLLRTVLSDPDPLVRRWAALALERRPASAEVAAGLRQALSAERDRAVRAVLERTLAAVDRELPSYAAR